MCCVAAAVHPFENKNKTNAENITWASRIREMGVCVLCELCKRRVLFTSSCLPFRFDVSPTVLVLGAQFVSATSSAHKIMMRKFTKPFIQIYSVLSFAASGRWDFFFFFLFFLFIFFGFIGSWFIVLLGCSFVRVFHCAVSHDAYRYAMVDGYCDFLLFDPLFRLFSLHAIVNRISWSFMLCDLHEINFAFFQHRRVYGHTEWLVRQQYSTRQSEAVSYWICKMAKSTWISIKSLRWSNANYHHYSTDHKYTHTHVRIVTVYAGHDGRIQIRHVHSLC